MQSRNEQIFSWNFIIISVIRSYIFNVNYLWTNMPPVMLKYIFDSNRETSIPSPLETPKNLSRIGSSFVLLSKPWNLDTIVPQCFINGIVFISSKKIFFECIQFYCPLVLSENIQDTETFNVLNLKKPARSLQIECLKMQTAKCKRFHCCCYLSIVCIINCLPKFCLSSYRHYRGTQMKIEYVRNFKDYLTGANRFN